MNFKLKLMNHLGFRKTCVFLFLLLGSVTMANAQTVSGTVSADGQPLPGASIVVKGTTKGTTTDFDGNFTIEANATSTLSISYIGYTTKEVLVVIKLK